MKPNGVTGALCASMLAMLAAGCTEDVGDCYQGGTRGLDTVLVSDHVEYAGQAIVNRACATGCHNSTISGAGRNGAPKGLDFDLVPVDATGAESVKTGDKPAYGKLDQAVINGLRERQRKVFSVRNLIWQQVKDGEMPPDGKFASFKTITSTILDSAETSPCSRGTALKELDSKQTQDLLRNWLACQAPIVESYGGPAERNPTAGVAGYQYFECSGVGPVGDGGAGDGGMSNDVVTFDKIYDTVMTDATCIGCHPSVDDSIDFSSVDIAYAKLVDDKAAKCGSKPFVTPGKPEDSFFVDLVSLDKPCPSDSKIMRMPVGPELSNAQIQLIRDWITGGALREQASIQAPFVGGLDAGVN